MPACGLHEFTIDRCFGDEKWNIPVMPSKIKENNNLAAGVSEVIFVSSSQAKPENETVPRSDKLVERYKISGYCCKLVGENRNEETIAFYRSY